MRKRNRKYRPKSKAQCLAEIQNIFYMRSPPSYDQRVELANAAYGFLDSMLTEPSGDNFINLVDVMNRLVTLINATDTKAKTDVLRCEDALEWLYKHTDEGINVAHTINACQNALIAVEERVTRTGSWALDSGTIALCELCITWYQELCSAIPKWVLHAIIETCDGIHKTDANGQHIGHFLLDSDYSIKEQVWASKS